MRGGLSRRPANSSGAASRHDGTDYVRVPVRTLVLLLALVALGAIGTVGFAVAWSGARGSGAEQAALRSTSRQFLVALTTFDSKSVSADFARIDAMATGSLAAKEGTLFGPKVRLELERARARSSGRVEAVFVQSMSAASATVYGVVGQTYSNDTSKAAKHVTLRILLGLVHTSPGWRVASVSVLQAPTSPSLPASSARSVVGGQG
ncbi:MAG: hypothetical protein M0035_18125 [Actinomycetota bacterium]|nr:hypothetical protein [Actinomycetota bacterium]